jgi:hypothetical protein
MALGSLVIAGVLTAVLSWRAAPADVPEPLASDIVSELGPRVSAALDEERMYVVEWADRRYWGVAATGLILDLHRRGYEVRVPPTYRPFFEEKMVARADDRAGTVLVVGEDDLRGLFALPPNATVVALHDPLPAGARARADQLWDEIARLLPTGSPLTPAYVDGPLTQLQLVEAGVDPTMIDELADLRALGSAYTVYVVPPSTSTG